MKLLTKSTIYIATLSLFLFFIVGIIFFHVLKSVSISDLNRELISMQEAVDKNPAFFLENHLSEIPGIDSISIKPSDNSIGGKAVFGDTMMFDFKTDQYRTFRYIEFDEVNEDGQYRIKFFKSTTPTDKLVERVTLMITLMVILFLAGIFTLNRYIFANLWKDFFNILDKMKQFDSEKKHVNLGEPDIEEFKELKKVLESMTQRLSEDYRELRAYTDHTTHELQTPLAVIKTKTELLLQSPSLGSDEIKLIQAIYSSANHLSRLNTTLALITRIENQQFTALKEICLPDLANSHIEMLQELMDLRKIGVRRIYNEPEQFMIMDPGLADVLMTNLLKNAIVHNLEGGSIELENNDNTFIVRNSGEPLSIQEGELFNRFTRDTKKSGNFGLGLSLVKKICDFYGISISYLYSGEMHAFTLTKDPQLPENK